MVARAGRPELDGGDPGLEERDGVGRAVAADALHVTAVVFADGVAQHLHVRVASRDGHGRALELL